MLSLLSYTPGELSLSLNPQAKPEIYRAPAPIPHVHKTTLLHSIDHATGNKRNRITEQQQREQLDINNKKRRKIHERGRRKISEEDQDNEDGEQQEQDDPLATHIEDERHDDDNSDDDVELNDLSDTELESTAAAEGLYEDMDRKTADQLRRNKRRQEDEEIEQQPTTAKHRRSSSSLSLSTTPAGDDPRLSRTLFIGNLPTSLPKKDLFGTFILYGKIESIRFRSFASADPKLPKKAAIIRGAFHPQQQSMNAYIVYEQEDSVEKALIMNGSTLGGHIIRVDYAQQHAKQQSLSSISEQQRSIFLGNLPFNVTNDQLHHLFSTVGTISYVRIIRDAKLNIGKGFGFVVFNDAANVKKALLLNKSMIGDRSIRVTRAMDAEKIKAIKQQQAINNNITNRSMISPASRRIAGKQKHGARHAATSSISSSSSSSSVSQKSFIGEISDARAYLDKQRKIRETRKEKKAQSKVRKSLVRKKS